MRIQRVLDSDIAMIFDECTPYPADEKQAGESMRPAALGGALAARALKGNANALFGIVHGGGCTRICDESLAGLAGIGFTATPSAAFVGEPKRDMRRILAHVHPGCRRTRRAT